MVTPREYLVSINLAKNGRGKFSAAGHAALAKAKAEGMKFDEPVKIIPVKTVKVVAPTADTPAVNEPVIKPKVVERPRAVNHSNLMVEAAPRYFHDNYIADDNGVKIKKTWRDACCGCGFSIRWCVCASGPSAFSHDTMTRLHLATVGKVSA